MIHDRLLGGGFNCFFFFFSKGVCFRAQGSKLRIDPYNQ